MINLRRKRPGQYLTKFEWIPGRAIDMAALARLRSHFKKPKSPMGEAWFMGGDRLMFNELVGDLDCLAAHEIERPLREIASGACAFGPYEEWCDWYHYLLGQLVTRTAELKMDSMLELLISGYMAIYFDEAQAAPYPQFHDDVLLTLGQCLMSKDCWDDSSFIFGSSLHRQLDIAPDRPGCWFNASGDFSASMFLCIRHLPGELIPGWLRSVFAIPSPFWRAQVLVWLVGMYALLQGDIRWPSEWPISARPRIYWDGSEVFQPRSQPANSGAGTDPILFLPERNRTLVLEVSQSYFTEDIFIDWLSSIATIPHIYEELAEIPATFEKLYV